MNVTENRTDALLVEILRWIRASSFASVQELIRKEFMKGSQPDNLKIKAYQLSDGKMTSVAIAKAVNVSQSQISRLWKRWRQMGIAEEFDGRTARSFSLDAFGLTSDEGKDDNE